jgi:Rod binding domain-containing protein
MSYWNVITPFAGAPAAPDDKQHVKEAGAAKDFEALLIAQMLRSVREEGSGWLGAGEEQASAAAFGLGEEELAKALTAGGGLGLSRVIQAGLAARDQAVSVKPAAPSPL